MRQLLLCFFFASALFVGCGDDDMDGPRNSFTLDGETYELTKGFLEDFGTNGNGSFDFDVTLTSATINYSEVQGSFNGVGDFVYLDFNTSSEDGLISGTYNFSSDRNAFTFVAGVVGTGYDLSTASGEDFTILGGTAEVSIDGTTTTIDFDITTSSNLTVTGSWTGMLREI